MLTSSFDSSSTNVSPRVLEERAQLAAAAVEQRADDHGRAADACRQAARAGAAHEAQQERFGLIVARVAERDASASRRTRARSKNA